MQYRNKELSWLSFNARILQEAADPDVPLLERLRFLGIHSSNQDEFFRVRVATLKRLTKLGKRALKMIDDDPREVLKDIQRIVLEQHQRSNEIYQDILNELAREQVFIINERQLDARQGEFVRRYFRRHIRRHLIPLMINQVSRFPNLRDDSTYLAVCLYKESGQKPAGHALIEVPTTVQSRFLVLPAIGVDQYVILLDDVIRYCLSNVFSAFHYRRFEAFAVKITRDSELDLDDDFNQSLFKQVAKSLKQRKVAIPVRFVYDANLPKQLHDLLVARVGLTAEDTRVPGARYHNLRDLAKFPQLGPASWVYEPIRPLPHRHIKHGKRLMETIRSRDILVHYPYHSFDYMIDFLREAAIDPKVETIKLTIYRAARDSSVINALINATRNGKAVTAVLELQARFDEEANLFWGNRLMEEGVKVIYGVPGLKVHSKLCLVSRRENKKLFHYTVIGTGNFNEDTARVYCDHSLFTADPRLTTDVVNVFKFFESNYKIETFHHLVVSPFNMRKRLLKLIQEETRIALEGRPAFITLKLNNLVDPEIIKALYRAAEAGVGIKLMVRSMFSVVCDEAGPNPNIRGLSLVDKFLEHSRIFVFGNDGDPRYFISSADIMPRNLDRRVEVTCPIYDKDIQAELRTYLEVHWRDNVKARVLNARLDNQINRTEVNPPTRAQFTIYDYLKGVHLKPKTMKQVVVPAVTPLPETTGKDAVTS